MPGPAEIGTFEVMLEAQRAAQTARKETPQNKKDTLRNDVIVMFEQNGMVWRPSEVVSCGEPVIPLPVAICE